MPDIDLIESHTYSPAERAGVTFAFDLLRDLTLDALMHVEDVTAADREAQADRQPADIVLHHAAQCALNRLHARLDKHHALTLAMAFTALMPFLTDLFCEHLPHVLRHAVDEIDDDVEKARFGMDAVQAAREFLLRAQNDTSFAMAVKAAVRPHPKAHAELTRLIEELRTQPDPEAPPEGVVVVVAPPPGASPGALH